MSRKTFTRSRRRVEVSVGRSVRIIRELQELSQNQLSARSGIPQSTISAIENDRVKLGVERAKTLARALRCHPAVLVFPGWDIEAADRGPAEGIRNGHGMIAELPRNGHGMVKE